MKKNLFGLCLVAVAVLIMGCDCVTIRRLKDNQYVYVHGKQLVQNVNQNENPILIPDMNGDSSKTVVESVIDNSNNGNGNGNGNNLSADYVDSSMSGVKYEDNIQPYNPTSMTGSADNTGSSTNEGLYGNNINLIVNVTGDYPRGPIATAELILDGATITSPHKTNAGQKNLEVNARGYESLSKYITIPSGSTEHTVDVEMIAKPRPVRFDFSDKKTGRKLTADQVIIGASIVRDGGKVKPGKHTVEVSCKGYQTYIGSFTLPAGEGEYVLKLELDPEAQATTLIKWIIYTEYPAGEEIPVPQSVTVDGIEIEQGSKIKTGSHQVIVKHPGHETLREDINVASGLKVFKYEGTLKTLPRKVEAQIKYDVEPPVELGALSVSLTSQKTGQKIDVGSGTSVKPGDYTLLITKEGYITVNKNVRIYPLLSPFVIDEVLEAKPVVIKTEVSYDIAPPANLGPHSVDFIGRNVLFKVYHDGSVKPGRYTYKVQKAGYVMNGNEKVIQISPSESPYFIRESMIAQPRQISLKIDKDGLIIEAEDVFIDGEKVTFDKTFAPGKQYRLVAKFRDYKTVEKTITIPPGTGIFVLDVPVIRK